MDQEIFGKVREIDSFFHFLDKMVSNYIWRIGVLSFDISGRLCLEVLEVHSIISFLVYIQLGRNIDGSLISDTLRVIYLQFLSLS